MRRSELKGLSHSRSNNNKKILYIDANNLYGWAMCQKLPYKDFTWSDDNLEIILNTPIDGDYGYYYECDLEYPTDVKDKTFNLPLGPEKKIINKK